MRSASGRRPAVRSKAVPLSRRIPPPIPHAIGARDRLGSRLASSIARVQPLAFRWSAYGSNGMRTVLHLVTMGRLGHRFGCIVTKMMTRTRQVPERTQSGLLLDSWYDISK
jgi:hypothetical protein